MLDSFQLSHDIKINEKSYFWRENINNLPSFTQCYNGCHYVTSGLSILLHGVISLPDDI